MEDVRVGERVRMVRLKRRLTQEEVAEEAGLRPIDVSHLEHGVLDELTIGALRRIVAAIGMHIDLVPKWKSVDLEREMVGAHDALQAAVLRLIRRTPGWVAEAEVTYSFFGDRGAIDILAWHAASRTLLIIELKTLLVEPAELKRKNDERRRRAHEIAAERGWRPDTVSLWVILTETRTNRARVARNAEILLTSDTLDGRAMRAWLRQPTGAVDALSYWTEPQAIFRRRVRLTKVEREARATKAAEQAERLARSERAAAARRLARTERTADAKRLANAAQAGEPPAES